MKYLDAMVYTVLMLVAIALFAVGLYLMFNDAFGTSLIIGFLSGLVYSIARDLAKDLKDDF